MLLGTNNDSTQNIAAFNKWKQVIYALLYTTKSYC